METANKILGKCAEFWGAFIVVPAIVGAFYLVHNYGNGGSWNEPTAPQLDDFQKRYYNGQLTPGETQSLKSLYPRDTYFTAYPKAQ
jgi:hypothetical protein